jgi:TonB family protein
MPAFPATRWLREFIPVPWAATEHLSSTLVAVQSSESIHDAVYVLPAAFSWPLLCLYLGSLFYFAIRLARSVRCTTLLRRHSRPLLLTPPQDEIWHDCKQSFCLKTVQILSSSHISGPVTFGLRTPVLLVPIGFAANCQSQDLLAALGHECAHIKRRDFMKNLFYEAVSLALAFHPAIWLIKSRIAQTREMVCDAMVAEKLIESRSYANSLLRLAVMVTKSSQVSTAHAIGIFDANILEKRIMSLNIQKQHLSSALKLALTISAALCLLTATIGATAMAVVIEPQSVPQADEPKSYGPIYHVGKEVVAPVMLGSGEVKFPESAQNIKAPFDATLVVGLVVDASGVPHDVHIVRSFRPDFDAKAVQAVEGYRFTPAKRRQKPVAVAVNLDIEFKKY